MSKGKKKGDLPEKLCVVCGRPFTWRAKWAKVGFEACFVLSEEGTCEAHFSNTTKRSFDCQESTHCDFVSLLSPLSLLHTHPIENPKCNARGYDSHLGNCILLLLSLSTIHTFTLSSYRCGTKSSTARTSVEDNDPREAEAEEKEKEKEKEEEISQT